MLAPLNMGTFKVINADTPVAATDLATKGYVDTAGIPTGAVFYFAASTPPAGYLECDGSSVSTSTYAALFAIVGYTYGGSGANFLLPDLRGVWIRGWDHGRGADTVTPNRVFGSGENFANASHTHAVAQTAHTHTITDPTHTHTQSTHTHAVNDPTHLHAIPNGALGSGVNLGAGSGFTLNTASGTSPASTGITIAGAFAGINNAATGISVAAATANITGNATSAQGSQEVTVKNVALLPCIKT